MATHSITLAWKIPWKEGPCELQSMGSLGVRHDWETSLSLSCIGEGNGNPLQCSCLENPRDGEAWWAPSMGSHRVGHDWSDLAAAAAARQETQVQSLGGEDLLEKEMATHFSILAWRSPWTEEPDGLQAMGSQIVGHNWVTFTHMRGSGKRIERLNSSKKKKRIHLSKQKPVDNF